MKKSSNITRYVKNAWRGAALGAALVVGVGAAAAGCGDDDGSSDPGPFDLAFNAETDFAVHDGQPIHVAVIDEATDQVIMTDDQVVGGGFWFYFTDLLEKGKSYRIDYWVDVDGDGNCDNPPEDHMWQAFVSTVGDDVTVDVTHNTDFVASACDVFHSGLPKFDVTFNGTGYSPHEGQTVHAMLIRADNDDPRESGTATITNGSFTFTWPLAVDDGLAYYIDFYADVDGNGTCEAGTDHVWRVDIPAVSGNVTVNETHNTNFTAAACGSF